MVNLPALESSNSSRPSDITETYLDEESETSADGFAATAFSRPVEEPEISTDETIYISFSHPVGDDISSDKLEHTSHMKPIASSRRPGRGSRKIVSKDSHYNTGTSSWKRQSKK